MTGCRGTSEGLDSRADGVLVCLTFTSVVLHADASYLSLFRLLLNMNRLISACSAKRSACSFIQRVELPEQHPNPRSKRAWKCAMMGRDSAVTNKGFTQSPARYLFIHATPIQLETMSSSSLMSGFASQTRRNSLKLSLCYTYRKRPCGVAAWIPPPKEYTRWMELQWSH